MKCRAGQTYSDCITSAKTLAQNNVSAQLFCFPTGEAFMDAHDIAQDGLWVDVTFIIGFTLLTLLVTYYVFARAICIGAFGKFDLRAMGGRH